MAVGWRGSSSYQGRAGGDGRGEGIWSEWCWAGVPLLLVTRADGWSAMLAHIPCLPLRVGVAATPPGAPRPTPPDTQNTASVARPPLPPDRFAANGRRHPPQAAAAAGGGACCRPGPLLRQRRRQQQREQAHRRVVRGIMGRGFGGGGVERAQQPIVGRRLSAAFGQRAHRPSPSTQSTRRRFSVVGRQPMTLVCAHRLPPLHRTPSIHSRLPPSRPPQAIASSQRSSKKAARNTGTASACPATSAQVPCIAAGESTSLLSSNLTITPTSELPPSSPLEQSRPSASRRTPQSLLSRPMVSAPSSPSTRCASVRLHHTRFPL